METDPERDLGLAPLIDRLRDTPPTTDLWPGIARQLEPRARSRALLISWPVALAAGLLLAVGTSVSTVMLMHRSATPTETTASAQRTAPDEVVSASFAPGDAALAKAADDLERVVRASLDHLDPEARVSVEKSLRLLDQAIAQAAARQTAAPDDPHAARYLTSTLRKKLQLLKTVSELTQQS